MKLRNKIVVFVLALLTSVMSVSIFSDNYIFHSIISSMGSQNARIDLLNAGAKDNSVKLVSYEADKAELLSPDWFKRSNGIGKVLHFKMKRRWQHYEVTLQAIGDGTLNIQFKGKERRVNGRRYPALVDFKNVYVNGRKHIGSRKAVWHDKPYTVKLKVKDGDKIVLKMEARKHIFRMSDFHRFYHTNFRMVLAVFIVSCLLYSFLVNMYLRGRARGGRRADMLFLVCFFIILVIPMLHISDEKRSKAENRNLAVYDPIVRNGKFNMNYGDKVDKWFADRFWGREYVMDMYFNLVQVFNKYPRIGGAIYNTETNWMFRTYHFRNRESVSERKIIEIIDSLKKFNAFIESKGAKLYLMIVPSKVDVYRQEAAFYKKINGVRSQPQIEKIRKESQFPVVFPYEKLMEFAQQDFVFFKTDHHWTDWGAFAGYQLLMEEISKDFPNINIANIDDYLPSQNNYVRSDWARNFWNGHTARLLGLGKVANDFLDVMYTYYDPKKEFNCEVKKQDGKYPFKYFKNNAASPLRAIVSGTSMNENLMQFIPHSFQEILYMRLNLGVVDSNNQYKIKKLYGKYILEFNPDVVILCFTEDNIPHLADIMKD